MARLERLDEPPAATTDTAEVGEPAASEAPVAPEPVAHHPEPEAPEPEPVAVVPAPAVEEPVSIPDPEPEPEPEPETEPEPDPVGDRAARSQPVASEPVIQRVVVGPNGSDTTSDSDSTADQGTTATPEQKPARRGWWQRQFGG